MDFIFALIKALHQFLIGLIGPSEEAQRKIRDAALQAELEKTAKAEKEAARLERERADRAAKETARLERERVEKAEKAVKEAARLERERAEKAARAAKEAERQERERAEQAARAAREEAERRVREERARAQAEIIIAAAAALEALPADRYLAASAMKGWTASHGARARSAGATEQDLPKELLDSYRRAAATLRDVEGWRGARNRNFVEVQLKQHKQWLDEVAGRPLTEAQRRAVVTDEDNNLIVAGAGTGKTSTIEARAAWLVRQGMARPEEILVLAFNKDVAAEIGDRLKARGLEGVKASTFHSIGYDVIGASTGSKPAISPLAESDVRLGKYLNGAFMELVADDRYMEAVSRWFVDLYVHTVVLDECKTPDERIKREKGLGLVTFGGLRLRSMSEVKVANWMSLHGISWRYEERYPHPPTDAQPGAVRRDYLPDFFLDDHDIWLEVWAVNRKGETMPTIDPVKYMADMEWKRTLHKANGTVMIEVFQDEIWSGDLGPAMERLFKHTPIRPRRISALERQQLLRGSVVTNKLVTLIQSFLSLYKGGAWEMPVVQKKSANVRDLAFLTLAAPLMARYAAELKQQQKIDYNDMLLQSAAALESGRYKGTWRHILVDEFQDTSLVRMRIVEALRAAVPESRLFLVGDDWQSIYRFAGSDLSLFTGASARLGAVARTDLDRTFRLLPDVQAVSATLVTRNPQQLKKNIQSSKPDSAESGICVHLYPPDARDQVSNAVAALKTALDDIRRQKADAKVRLLGRYNASVDEAMAGPAVAEARKHGLTIEGSTVHRSKGLEADHVILIAAASGAFPSEIVDDPVLRMVSVVPEPFPNAEERRLFYVALTRTKGRIYLLAPQGAPSSFVEELLDPAFSEQVEVLGTTSDRHRCPRCQGRTIHRKSGPHGDFWVCLNWPGCEGRLENCQDCPDGALVRSVDGVCCSSCKRMAEPCPKCSTGIVRLKRGLHGSFFGCSRWQRDGAGCNYTRKA